GQSCPLRAKDRGALQIAEARRCSTADAGQRAPDLCTDARDMIARLLRFIVRPLVVEVMKEAKVQPAMTALHDVADAHQDALACHQSAMHDLARRVATVEA